MKPVLRNLVLITIAAGLSILPASAQRRNDDRPTARDAFGTAMERFEEPEASPESEAADHYRQGVALLGRAQKLEHKARGVEGAKKSKLLAKVGKAYEGAVREFQSAIRKNPGLLDAYSGLGRAYRGTGQLAESLIAYEEALSHEPGFTEAISGRGEVLVALDRLDEAKQAYETLATRDRENARALLQAMEQWVQQHREDRSSRETVEALAAWVRERGSS